MSSNANTIATIDSRKPNTKQELIAANIKLLIEQLEAGHSDALTNYLTAMSRFHSYSFGNVLEIARQMPAATRVAGFWTWKNLGRSVKAGQKGIRILAPIVGVRRKKDAEAQKDITKQNERILLGFRNAYVFDISQTDGVDLPEMREVSGDPGDSIDRLTDFLHSKGIALVYNEKIAPALGMSYGGRIALLPGQSKAENRAACEDFETFKPLFERVQRELASGVRQAIPVQSMDEFKLTEIKQGQFFIVGGQVAYVDGVGENFKTLYDRRDSRLRVIYDNGTESNLLIRSFQRSLYPDKDKAGRLITNPEVGPLFANETQDDDLASGTIYVLRSKSEHPLVVANRDVLHKIGVTGGKIETRIANAALDPTFLMADVEVIATYQLFNINRVKLENIIHRVFGPAQMDIEIQDRFGNPVKPREWFLVPHFVVDEAVERIKDGTIPEFVYDPATARLVRL